MSAVDGGEDTAPALDGSPAGPCLSCACSNSAGAPTRSFLRIDQPAVAGGDGAESSASDFSKVSAVSVLALPAVAIDEDETASSLSMSMMSSMSDAPGRHCSPLKKAWCERTLASGYVGCSWSSSGRGTTGSRSIVGQMSSREPVGSSLSRTGGFSELAG
jgi:hypothetical protein